MELYTSSLVYLRWSFITLFQGQLLHNFLKKFKRSRERKLSITFLDRPEKVILLTQHRSENKPEEYIKLEDVAGSICKTRQA